MLNKLANIDSLSPKLHKDQRNRFRFILHWFNIISISFLVIWVVIGNFAAYQLEQPVLIARSDLVRQFPQSATNDSQLRRKEIQEKFNTIMSMSDDIRSDLSKYVEDSNITPSNSLQNYLATKSENLAVLRSYVLQSDIPIQEIFDLDILINKGTFDSLPRSFLGEFTWQRILIADAVNNYRLGKMQIAFDSLEVAWRLNQANRNQPILLSQLVANICDSIQIQGLRKIAIVPPIWQKRLVSFETSKSMLRSALKFETFALYGLIRNFPLRKGGSEKDGKSMSLFNRFLHPFVQPYYTLSAVDTWQVAMRDLDLGFNQDPCMPISYEDMPKLSSWNILGLVGSSSSNFQVYKLTKRQIDMELMQKILKLREVASQTGKFPQTIAGIDSSVICKNLRYVYQPSADGESMTISLSNQNRPEWLAEREGDIPLSYTTKLRKL
ncbi:hypothetical protein APA_1236 [Pseudanabaena sp. lw0831]|uniref:hypothetical protein n=1 Tax=Pseudanabaena sp. lw0831 TaxID=1357935 RepID=UPI00191530BF|nr:hypothetical protein [Pseudanabaena sp. lw0831]GBO53329.1 hypothetical protein APA_1236 [Pseudanabaena sp. lw0831]